ncbi:hypothetical protein [Methanimicrococcus blatticola]|uniref:Uncharacterized protein n=1 Tax=Methanimicrococcus blatticola TaxID=91560 RepID=A0A484F4J0_9EURY|nr:hypothetical protein [Methanimicrococcus blatticola]MBZ3935390.1 hypothetical protein [Methanimicrococcus blatticola]MCC2508512.1 hypothetical protein [Methanimicrococcus blatticola]TDQ67822.1 hypothetical protein C7391_1375 [Methanimicrococcus blatticola]
MAGLFNQSEKTNNILFVVLLLGQIISYGLFISFVFYTSNLTVYYFQVITLLILIFGPAVYTLISQNLKKSLLFSLLVPVILFLPTHPYLEFLESIRPFYSVVIFNPSDMDLLYYKQILLQYSAFAVGGMLSSVLAYSYQPDKDEITWKTKIPFNLLLLFFLVIYGLFLIFSGFYR